MVRDGLVGVHFGDRKEMSPEEKGIQEKAKKSLFLKSIQEADQGRVVHIKRA